ncbi:13864_t:CDS:2, partial [Acaulospora colombiana]
EAEGVRVDDEDWEIAEKDFTKQYNRLRIYNELASGQPQKATSNNAKGTLLPAINRPKQPKRSTQQQQEATEKRKELDKRVSDQLTALSKYSSRIANIDVPYSRPDDPTTTTNTTTNAGGEGFVLGVSVNRKGPSAVANQKDKADRATTEQVLDPRTRIILFKMIGRELVKEINGCVSTDGTVVGGKRDEEFKEAKGCGGEVSRGGGGEGERVGHGFPRPSPRLKDADVPVERFPALYHDLMVTTRTIYQQCKLVHADLSEYNILFHNDALWIIDVSQSVEHDHPSAFEFLRMDLKNVGEVLGGEPSEVLTKWIDEEEVGEDEGGDEEERTRLEEEAAATQATEESVFLSSFIPRSLGEVLDPEKNYASGQAGTADKLVAKSKRVDKAPTSPSKNVRFTGVPRQEDESESEEEDEEDEKDEFVDKKPRGHRHEDKDAKKERKKAVKEEQREKRKTKMPKADKKKAIKKSRGGPTSPTPVTDPTGTGGENTVTATPNATTHDIAEKKDEKASAKEENVKTEAPTDEEEKDVEKGKALVSPINESDLLSGKRLAVVWSAFLLYVDFERSTDVTRKTN